MRISYSIGALALAFQFAPISLADTLTLKSGRVVEGTYLGGTARLIRMEVGDGVQSFAVDQVVSVQFGGPGDSGTVSRNDDSRPSLRRQSSRSSDPDRPVLIRPDSGSSSSSSSGQTSSDPDRPVLRRADSSSSQSVSSSGNSDPDRPVLRRSDDSSSASPSSDRPVLMRPDSDVSSATTASSSGGSSLQGIQIPSGTQITVRMIEPVDSQGARVGDTFRASVDEPVSVNGQIVIPRGADAMTKLVEDQQSGKLTGKTVLKLALSTVRIGGQNVDVTTQDVVKESSSRGARSAGVIGGATALGAIIGGIAGGGKGAAIGAGSGAGAGTGAEELGKGQRVKIPSETRLVFTLSSSVQL